MKFKNPAEKVAMLNLLMTPYLGEKCQGCGKAFETIDQLREAVWWPHDGGRVGHKTCFAAAHPNHALRN